MKILVTGALGQLGHDVVNEAKKRGHIAVASDIEEEYPGESEYVSLDITDKQMVFKVIETVKPDAVVHCAAFTAVDAAEEEDKKELVLRINSKGTGNIAEACRKIDARMIYISTDYVFNGQGTKSWDPDDENYEPLNVYGDSKLKGELAVKEFLSKYYIVRTSWVFGVNGKNFIKTMINAGKSHDQVKVVNDQIGSPTYTVDLAVLLIDMVEQEKYGIYHAANSGGYISWYEFCKEAYSLYGLKTEVIPVTTEEYGLNKAKRPFNSRFDMKKLEENGFESLPDWKDALKRYLKEAKL